MDLKEHIELLVSQAKEDLGASEALAKAGYYAHALFWAHLTLEKLCKALWVHHNNSIEYPYIHNLMRLLKECNINLTDEQLKFYGRLNQFQSEGRYTDELRKVEESVNKETCFDYLQKVKSEMQWLLNQM